MQKSALEYPDASGCANGTSMARARQGPQGRTLGLDLGGARCGLAIDDDLGRMAHPRPNLPARDERALIAALVKIAREEGAMRMVLGLPLEMSGVEGRSAQRVRAFAQKVADAAGVEVVLWDERLSTVQAARALHDAGLDARAQKAVIDAASAVAILQSWLDARKAVRARTRGGH